MRFEPETYGQEENTLHLATENTLKLIEIWGFIYKGFKDIGERVDISTEVGIEPLTSVI